MDDDERIRIVKGLLIDHVSNPAQRHVRDGWAVHLLAKEIIEKLDHRTGVWRKWDEAREALLKSATHCWIPIEDLRAYLNGMPGPELTRMDVIQRLRAFQEEPYADPVKSDLQPGCLEIFERENADGTELPAIIGAIQQWVEEEEARRWQASDEARRRQIEEDRIALEQRFLSGADCQWTAIGKSPEVYCRRNGRAYRLSPAGDKTWNLHRINGVDDQGGALMGTYRRRADATKAVAAMAYLPEPRW
jgi:hypothetical protein